MYLYANGYVVSYVSLYWCLIFIFPRCVLYTNAGCATTANASTITSTTTVYLYAKLDNLLYFYKLIF